MLIGKYQHIELMTVSHLSAHWILQSQSSGFPASLNTPAPPPVPPPARLSSCRLLRLRSGRLTRDSEIIQFKLEEEGPLVVIVSELNSIFVVCCWRCHDKLMRENLVLGWDSWLETEVTRLFVSSNQIL